MSLLQFLMSLTSQLDQILSIAIKLIKTNLIPKGLGVYLKKLFEFRSRNGKIKLLLPICQGLQCLQTKTKSAEIKQAISDHPLYVLPETELQRSPLQHLTVLLTPGKLSETSTQS